MHFLGEIGVVANAGGALGGDPVAILVVIVVVAALETGGTGETGFLDGVIVGDALVVDTVPGFDERAVEPPFVATEQQVGVGDLADTGGGGPVSVIGGDGKGLGRDDSAMAALRGKLAIVVQAVGVVHGLYPATYVVGDHGFERHGVGQALAHPAVQVGCVEGLVVHRYTSGVARYRQGGL